MVHRNDAVVWVAALGAAAGGVVLTAADAVDVEEADEDIVRQLDLLYGVA